MPSKKHPPLRHDLSKPVNDILPPVKNESVPLKVLIIEDSEADVLPIIHELKKGDYHPVYERVETSASVQKALREKSWDVILCGYDLPQFNASTAIALLKETKIDIPIIVVSGAVGEENAVDCLLAGASDFVLKGNLSRLCPAVKRQKEDACLGNRHKQAGQSVQGSEVRYRNTVDNIQDGYYEVDLAGNYTIINDALCNILGYTKEELTGMNNRQYTDEENAKIARTAYAEIYKTGKPGSLIGYEIIRKDKTKRQLEVTASLIIDPSGKPIGFRGVSRDVTERKQMEEKIRLSEQRYRNILETIQEAYYEVDLAGTVTFLNSAFAEHLGYSKEELLGMKNSQYTHPDSYTKVYEAFNQLYRTGVPIKSVEDKIIRKDGSIGVSELSATLMRDLAGKPVGFAGLSRDVSERKKMEEKLRQSEERYRSILENMQEAYFENDLEGRMTFVNDAACKHLGYTKEELIGTKSSSFQDEAGGKKTHQAYNQLYKTGQPVKRLESEFVRKDGSRGVYELSVDLNRDSQGTPTGFRGVSRDITGRIQAEQEMKKAKEAAEAASAAKSEFLANMSHEIRTPMNGVIGMIGLLLDTNLDDEQRRYAQIVHSSGELLLGLINNILDFSKMEAMKLDLETLDFDLSILLEDFAATLALQAYEKGLELLCAADLDVPTQLRGDPGRLRQILANLTGNAVKFTQTGEVAVRVSLMETTENDVLLRFSVRDTGIGIPKDKLALLFNKFSQVDASTTRRYGGTGLGLVISKQLAELLGGKAGVISEAGKGSEFWFTARLGKQAGEGMVESVPPADLRNVRVLIVDDNATNREILTIRLASWGMQPSEAQDGPRALQAFYRARDENNPFRIAVIDMQMPGMDGETLGRIIKADKRLADTRMVMLTSLGMRGDAKRFQEIGFEAYVTKPLRHQELKTILSMALTERDGAQPAHWSIVTRHTALETQNMFAGRKVRILLAEDNITNQQVALGILKKLGLHADAVANGAEAVNALETIPYDLVLMDVQMPVMDGITATGKIRNWKMEIGEEGANPASSIKGRASCVPIIAMTAHAMQGDRERCLTAGMNDYVSKPVSPQALVDALGKWLPALGRVASDGEGFPPQDPLTPVFDKAGMLARLMDDEDLVRVVAEGFLEDIPQQVAVLAGYLKTKDAQGVERQAHSIKGASANVSGEALSKVAFAIEKAGKQGDLDAADTLLAPLVEQFDRLKQAMIKEMKLTLKGEQRKDAS